jgi:hypothetical protein
MAVLSCVVSVGVLELGVGLAGLSGPILFRWRAGRAVLGPGQITVLLGGPPCCKPNAHL